MYTNPNQPQEMQDRYKELPPEITELFEYGTVDVAIEDCAKEFGLNESQQESLLMEIELVLYLFLPQQGTEERIKESLNIDETRAQGISNKLDKELFLIVKNILDFVNQQFEEDEEISVMNQDSTVEDKQTGNAQGNYMPTDSPNPVNTTKPTTNAHLQEMRTFAKDVERSRAHGYGAFRSSEQEDDEEEVVHKSSQDDTLKRSSEEK